MSRQFPDSSRALEGHAEGRELPQVATDLPDSTAGQMAAFYSQGPGERTDGDRGDGQWLLTAQQCYRNSTDFFDSNLRKTVEESMDLYRSKHPAGSKYNLPSFSKRSRLFRPKIRSAMRKKEAQVAKAFFATSDLVTIDPRNAKDPNHVKAAKVQDKMLNYRLKQPQAMNWFMTVVGAFQDASRQGFIVSKTEWVYRTARRYFSDGSHEDKVVQDRPGTVLIPCENLRISPNCDWIDPINSSDYLIELMPMSIIRVREMMGRETMYKWREVTDQQLMSGSRQEWDSVRQAREGNRQDRYDQRPGIDDYETVWIHKNIVRIEGEDYVYLTIGTQIMLTDPMPLSELDPRGYRGYEWGFTVLESHNPYPDGDVQLAKPLSEEINEVANMRADAIKMATIGRYFARRGSAVDTEALVRFVPGSVVEVQNTQTDVRWDKAPDVGRGAFEEHNVLNQELADLMGTFQSGEVQGNRKLNETVGGMQLLADNANEVSEFTVRTFSESWVEPVLQHMLDLMCLWETDQNIATIVGDEMGMDVAQVFRMLQTPMSVIVNVGFGATNPESRLRRLQMGVATAVSVDPMIMMTANKAEILSEIFGALGYPDVSRFFPVMAEEDPEKARLREENMQLRQIAEQGGAGDQSKVEVARMNNETKLQLAQMQSQDKAADRSDKQLIERGKQEIAMIDLRIRYEQNDIKKNELYMQREALSHTIQMAEREFALNVATLQQNQQNADADRTAAAEDRKSKQAEGQAKQKPAVPDATPPGVQQLINNLRQPASGSVDDSEAVDVATGAPDMQGDAAGVIARGNYGAIPGVEG